MNALVRKLKTGLSLVTDRRWTDLALVLRRNLNRQDPSEIVARIWDLNTQVLGTQWQDTPGIDRRWNRMITGNPDQGYIEYTAEQYFASSQPKYVLSLGCGDGWWEQAWAAKYPFAKVVGYDISPTSIENARKTASTLTIPTTFEYQVVDINFLDLTSRAFDLVLMNASLHHVRNLEHILSEISRHLSPMGLFILNDFVGPSHFQWTDRQIEIINGLVSIIPHRYRQSLLFPGKHKASISRPRIEHMVRADPSEAVRSADILGLLPNFFEIMEYRPWGGAILHLLLYEIAGNFSEDRPEDVRLLQILFDIEDVLMQTGDIGTDFVFVVCKPK
jgi:ubiquinone/menaquinone biosynthesis C-methylase UbiE